jgi:protein TonB
VLAAVLAVHALGLWALLAGLSDPPELRVPGEVVTTVLLLPEQASAVVAAAPAAPAAARPQPAKPQPPVKPAVQPSPTPSASSKPQPPAALPAALPTQAPSAQAPAGASSPAVPASQAAAAPASAAAGSTTVAAAASPAPARIELPSSSADYLNNPRPAYPPLSKRLGEEGKVVLRVLIEADGSASKAEIRSSSGYDRLDQAALQTVLRWRYLPGKRGGVAEAMWFNVPINFVLE